jgi:hypothetical protein
LVFSFYASMFSAFGREQTCMLNLAK